MNLVGVFCLLTGARVKAAHGAHSNHESKLFQTIWDALNKGDVLVADRGVLLLRLLGLRGWSEGWLVQSATEARFLTSGFF